MNNRFDNNDLFFSNEKDRIIYCDSSPTNAPTKISVFGENSSFILDHHLKTKFMEPFYTYKFENMIIGGGGVLSKDEKPFMPTECFPPYISSMLENSIDLIGKYWLEGMYNIGVKTIYIDQPVYMPFHPNYIYGHFLLEVMPKILVIRDYQEIGIQYPIIMPSTAPKWARDIVNYIIKNPEIIEYDPYNERVLAKTVLVPPIMTSDDHLHPSLTLLIEKFITGGSLVENKNSDKIYLSRSKLNKDASWHLIEEEEEIEKIHISYGYNIIHPQDISFKDQIKLYKKSKVISGEFSSAMHNSIFSQTNTSILCLNWINWIQSRISAFKQQPISYISPIDGIHDWTTQHQGFQSLRFSSDLLKQALDEIELRTES